MKKLVCLVFAVLTVFFCAFGVRANSPMPVYRESYYAGVDGLEITYEAMDADGTYETQTCTLEFGSLVTLEDNERLIFVAPDGKRVHTASFTVDLSGAFPAGEDVLPSALGVTETEESIARVSEPGGTALRYGPNTPFEIKTALRENERLTVLASWGDWSYVSAKQFFHAAVTGWVKTASLSEAAEHAESAPARTFLDLLFPVFRFEGGLTTLFICILAALLLSAICVVTVLLLVRAKKRKRK